VATESADGRRLVFAAINCQANGNTLLVQLEGAGIAEEAVAILETIAAGPTSAASLEHPSAIAAESRPFDYARDFTMDLEPFTVAVLDIRKA
jgi:alpha-L-arabinofuranosidase